MKRPQTFMSAIFRLGILLLCLIWVAWGCSDPAEEDLSGGDTHSPNLSDTREFRAPVRSGDSVKARPAGETPAETPSRKDQHTPAHLSGEELDISWVPIPGIDPDAEKVPPTRLSSGVSGAEPGVVEIPLEDRAMAGSGGLFVKARPEGVTAVITTPSGKRYETACPFTLKDLPAGTYRVRLTKPLYHPKELPLEVGLGIATESATLHPNFGWLTVTSDPSGASVHLGGTYLGTTPVTRKQKKSGPYDLKVALPRYHDYQDEVIIADERNSEVNVSLKPAFGTLVINSTPSGAEVWIDGAQAGSTPFRKELTSARYLVSLRKDLYDPVLDRRITVSDGRTTEKTFPLRADFGTLKVTSTPSGAGVWVDGKHEGTTPWETKLTPGNYRLKVDKDAEKWVPKEYNLRVVREKEVSIITELPRKKGGLNIYTEPAGDVEVFVDGGKNPKGKAPCTISELVTGEYTVICRGKKNGEAVIGKETVKVEWGKVKSVTVRLKPEGGSISVESEPAGAEILLDGEETGKKTPAVLMNVMAGPHRVKVQKKDHPPGEEEVTVKSGEVGTVRVTLQKGPRVIERDGAYVLFENGIVKDTSTGLEWKAGPDENTNWYEAQSWVQGLNLDGGGWRMPNMDELNGLYENGKGDRNMTSLLKTTGWRAWSGENKGLFNASARHFNFDNGTGYTSKCSWSFLVRAFAVRSRKSAGDHHSK